MRESGVPQAVRKVVTRPSFSNTLDAPTPSVSADAVHIMVQPFLLIMEYSTGSSPAASSA